MNAIWGMVLVLFLTVASGITATPVAAEEYACRGTVGARTLDNVRVPSGATCVLDGTTVKGTVTVGANATLKARGARVIGNIQAENHKLVVVNGGTAVGGSIQIDQGGAHKVTGAKVTGSIQASSNAGSSLLRNNTVNADIQVIGHRNGVEISSNRVDGNLQCKENSPAPTGGGNVAQGGKEDQCSRL